MKKVKLTESVLRMLGIIFVSIGIIFIITGILFLAIPSSIRAAGVLFFGMSAQLLVIGSIFLTYGRMQKKRIQELMEGGHFVDAKIIEIKQNPIFERNGIIPYFVYAQYTDEEGTVHSFQSRGMDFNPEGLLLAQEVRVYVQPDDYRYYHMDINSILLKEESLTDKKEIGV